MPKVSVTLSDDIHRRLKLASVQRGTSIQNVMEVAAQSVIDPRPAIHRPTPKEVRMWQSKLKTVLQHGDELAILNCTASIEAMYRLTDQRDNGATESQPDAVQILSISHASAGDQVANGSTPATRSSRRAR